MISIEGQFGKADVMIDTVEQECISQITSMLNHPIFCNPVKIMPDCHSGKASVIGFTMGLSHGICPNTVGVDIGCGMTCWITNPLDHINLMDVDKEIRSHIPLGMNTRSKPVATIKDDYSFTNAQSAANNFIMKYNKYNRTNYTSPIINYEWFVNLCKRTGVSEFQVNSSIGTLGGGNHFIEIGKSTSEDLYYLTIHSGSRNFGKKIAEYFQQLAQSKTYNKGYSKDFAYLVDDDAIDYYMSMIFVQEFARLNRMVMGKVIEKIIGILLFEAESVHNYIDFHDMILRKGAISSYKNQKMIIPFNMRDGMAICTGKSNPGYNFSAPHGAGRIMSRSQAKNTFTLDEFKKDMEGVVSTSVNINTLDESPGTYKPMNMILEAIKPTADVITMVKPIYNLKG